MTEGASQKQTMQARLGGVFFVPLFVVLALVFGAVAVLLPIISQTPQAFPEVVLELVASMGYTNKSGELDLFWGLLAAASALMAALAFYIARSGARQPLGTGGDTASALPPAARAALRGVALLVVPNAVLYLVMGQFSVPLLLLAILYLAMQAVAPALAEKALLLCVCAHYALCGLIAAGNWAGLSLRRELNGTLLLALTALLALPLLAWCVAKARRLTLNRAVLALQCALPLCLSIYAVDRYRYGDSYVRVAYPAAWYVVVLGGVLALCGFAVLGARKRWNDPEQNWQSLILMPTLITLFVFNSYILPAQYFQSDTHHHGEQMLPWQQIVTLGQAPYEDYSPASGLFPMIIGFFQNVLLGGATNIYPAALALTSAGFAVLTICLVAKAAGRGMGLAVAYLFSIPVYDRQYMVLPVLLLLSLPALCKRRWLWLPVWVFCCFLAGLYYPVYGVALIVGSLPFALVQAVALFRSGEFRARVRKWQTWAVWAGCLVPIAASAPLLLHMVRHTLLFSDNSTLSDGISIFGTPVSDGFLPWLEEMAPGIRLALYYGVRYALPIVGVLVFLYCAVLYLAGGKGGGRAALWEKLQSPAFFCFTAGVGVLAVSYTFTTVREDYYSVIARTGPILAPMLGIFLATALHRYGHLILKKGTRAVLTGLLLGLAIYVYNDCYMMNFPSPDNTLHRNGGAATVLADSDAKKLVYAHEVPEGYLLVDAEMQARYPRLGSGFISGAQLDQLNALDSLLADYIAEDFYIANISARQMYYYPLNAKAPVNGTWSLFKSGAVQNAVIDWLEQHPNTVGFESTPFTSYVLYHYLAAQRGCVIADGALWMFPEVAAQQEWEWRTAETDYPYYSWFVTQMDLGNYAGSMGKSMDTLAGKFTEAPRALTGLALVDASPAEGGYILGAEEAAVEFSLDAPVGGMEADFLYMELESSIDLSCDYGKGRMFNALMPNRRGEEYKVTVYWASEAVPAYDDARSFVCNYSDGRLLIPMGANPAWLWEDNISIMVRFGEGFAAGDTVALKDARFLLYDRS